ncbi:PREDICTED: uncharacterized protein LOC108769110 [Trachymyrmex cornetzi]|uniref:uncharacterized protein LOC108769110 n=1 Tax=Trachymyrmex cornetzi TaxID=471704 RepID=UPI00084F4B1B|nr:PREDICTED: uncharacterized protein LOC108769110 [Trachymyrmex cornetzi]
MACITVKGLDARPLPEVCSRDLTTVEVMTTGSAGGTRRLIICSAYFPHGEGMPPSELFRLVDLCQREGLPLLMGCDANAHHTIWGNTDTNERGRKLLEYLVTTDLVLNRGNKPTFCVAGRSEVLGLTLCSRESVREVREWKVSDEPSLSDHRLITFRLSDLKVEVKKVTNPKRTDWDSCQRNLGRNLRDFPKRTVTSNRETPWWNPRLQNLNVRRAWNKARYTGRPSDWDLYRKTQKDYRDSVVEAKKKSWRDFYESVEGIPATARLFRFLSTNPETALEAVRMSDGIMASGERCLVQLLETNFPGFQKGVDRCWEVDVSPFGACANDWKLAAEIVRSSKVRWAIGSIQPFKSVGPDIVFPALLQRGLEQVIEPLTMVLGACLALGYTRQALRKAQVVFIPKTLEKLVDVYIRDCVLARYPLHAEQHAYRAGHSRIPALHSVIYKIEKQFQQGGFLVGTFLDFEEAFNNTPHEVVCAEAAKRGVPMNLVKWILGMLRRQVTTSLRTLSVEGWVRRGCPQGGVLSTFPWCLVADRLLEELNGKGFKTIGCTWRRCVGRPVHTSGCTEEPLGKPGASAGQGVLAILSGASAKIALCCCGLAAKDTVGGDSSIAGTRQGSYSKRGSGSNEDNAGGTNGRAAWHRTNPSCDSGGSGDHCV